MFGKDFFLFDSTMMENIATMIEISRHVYQIITKVFLNTHIFFCKSWTLPMPYMFFKSMVLYVSGFDFVCFRLMVFYVSGFGLICFRFTILYVSRLMSYMFLNHVLYVFRLCTLYFLDYMPYMFSGLCNIFFFL